MRAREQVQQLDQEPHQINARPTRTNADLGTFVFQAFERLHTHVEGTGVGLYMIKRLIENAGATITVTSTAGVGSAFVVTFPG